MYVAVTSPYPLERSVTASLHLPCNLLFFIMIGACFGLNMPLPIVRRQETSHNKKREGEGEAFLCIVIMLLNFKATSEPLIVFVVARALVCSCAGVNLRDHYGHHQVVRFEQTLHLRAKILV